MPGPAKYVRELRERAVRMVLEHRDEYDSEWEAIRSIAAKLGIGTTETSRKWVLCRGRRKTVAQRLLVESQLLRDGVTAPCVT